MDPTVAGHVARAKTAREVDTPEKTQFPTCEIGLELHPDKTRVVCLIRGKQGFDFLGFHHHKVELWRWRGHYYQPVAIGPSDELDPSQD